MIFSTIIGARDLFRVATQALANCCITKVNNYDSGRLLLCVKEQGHHYSHPTDGNALIA